MIITKKQSKNLRYLARANYKSVCKGVETENGKVKHREFPCFELAYDESKATAGNVELTNVTIGGKPFDGDYDALMARLRVLLDSPDDICAEELEQDKTLTEQAVDAVKAKSDTIVIAEKPGDILKETLKDCFPEGSEISVDVKPEENKIDVKAFSPNSVDHIDTKIEVKPVEEPLGVLKYPSGLIKNEAECLEALAPSYENYPPQEPVSVADIPEEVKENVLEVAETVTTLVHPEMQVVSREIKDLSDDGTLTVDVKAVANNPVDSVDVYIDVNKLKEKNAQDDTVDAAESAKFVEDHDAPILEVNAQNVEIPVVENLEEAKRVAEETGKPVITAEQVSSVHLDAAADGSHDETAVFVPKEQKPKKLTRAELYDLQMKCGVRRLATLYGEDPNTGLDVLMKLYPDAATRLNEVYAADGIKTYTITEEAIKNAYPDEYAVLCP